MNCDDSNNEIMHKNKRQKVEVTVQEKICVICERSYSGYGNSSEPVSPGLCCDRCNVNVVVKLRIFTNCLQQYFDIK